MIASPQLSVGYPTLDLSTANRHPGRVTSTLKHGEAPLLLSVSAVVSRVGDMDPSCPAEQRERKIIIVVETVNNAYVYSKPRKVPQQPLDSARLTWCATLLSTSPQPMSVLRPHYARRGGSRASFFV